MEAYISEKGRKLTFSVLKLSLDLKPANQPVLPEVFSQKSPVLAIFCQKTAIYRHHPLFIAFLCGNEL